jgi:glycosyltransferase involved in cell wall biosynthesis
MRILWCTHDRSTRTESYYENWLNNLGSYRGIQVDFHRAPTGDLRIGEFRKRVLSGEIKPDPLGDIRGYDAYIVEDLFSFWHEDWKSIRAPKALFLEDLHGNHPKQVRRGLENGFSVIFFRYKTHFERLFGHLRDKVKCIWLPMSVDINYFKPVSGKIRDVVMLGAVNNVYPTRQQIVRALRGHLYFELIKRPKELWNPWERWPTGEDYVRILSESKICPTGGSIYHYPVAKYLEISACNTLLMSDWFNELGMLGFRHRINMVALQPGRIRHQVEWWLANDEMRERVASNGMQLVRRYHSGEVRAKQFVSALKAILDGKNPTPVAYDRQIKKGNESLRRVQRRGREDSRCYDL